MTDARRRYSLRRRLLTGMIAGFGAIIAILAFGLWSYARDAANHAYDLLLTGAAIAILERASSGAEGPSVDIPYSALEMLGQAKEDRVFYHIFSKSGGTITGDEQLPRPVRYRVGSDPVYFDDQYRGETVRFVIQARLLAGGAQNSWVIAQIGHTRRARDQLEWQLLSRGLAVIVFITCIGLGFVWIGINRALRPLAGVEQDLHTREPADLTPLQATPPREIENLISAINGFMSRLKTSQDNAQTFIADVAHQTRTSLSALQGQIDLAIEQDNLSDTRKRLKKASNQSKRTIRLTTQLLTHAMVIHRADNQPHHRVDLVALIKACLEESLRDTIMKDIQFEFIRDGMCESDKACIVGDPISLREAVRNLLDNAVKHGPDSNTIYIKLSRQEDDTRVRLTISDCGPGIPAHLRNEAFQRFTSFSNGKKGSGLGLSIVQAVAHGHGAEVTLGESPCGGLEVEFLFPEASCDA